MDILGASKYGSNVTEKSLETVTVAGEVARRGIDELIVSINFLSKTRPIPTPVKTNKRHFYFFVDGLVGHVG